MGLVADGADLGFARRKTPRGRLGTWPTDQTVFVDVLTDVVWRDFLGAGERWRAIVVTVFPVGSRTSRVEVFARVAEVKCASVR